MGGNTVSGNSYTAAGWEATGILVIDGKVSIDSKNTLSGNRVDLLIEGDGIVSGKKYSA